MAEPPGGGSEGSEPPEQPRLPEEPPMWDWRDEPGEGELEDEEAEEPRHRTEETPAASDLDPHTEETEAQTLPFGTRHEDLAAEQEPPEWTPPAEPVEHEAQEGEPPAEGEERAPAYLPEEEPGYHTIEDTDYAALEEDIHSPQELRERRDAERAARRRVGRQRLAVLILGIVALVVIIVLATGGGGGGSPTTTTNGGGSPLTQAGVGPSYLRPTSQAGVLSGSNVLIADRNNKRLLDVSAAGQPVWSTNLNGPSDAYPTRTLQSVIVTEHGNFQVLQVGVKRHDVIYHYGHSGVPGAAANRLHDPGTAHLLSSGQLVIADKSNCRILFVRPPGHRPSTTLGRPHHCGHRPPSEFGYPDAVFPTSSGGLVVSEFVPAWVDILDSHNNLVKALRPAGLTKPVDANQVSGQSNEYIAANFAHPGSVEVFDDTGKVLWSYGPKSGSGELFDPTLAQVLPNGDVLVSDSRNDRVIVIDHSTKKIVWQYGHTGKPGSRNGYLHTPDSAVAVP
jgi:PQQ-like domain